MSSGIMWRKIQQKSLFRSLFKTEAWKLSIRVKSTLMRTTKSIKLLWTTRCWLMAEVLTWVFSVILWTFLWSTCSVFSYLLVLISSVEPLRVYRYNSEMLVRFCPEPYHPFNASNIEQYVIYETHASIEDLPSFKKISENFGFTHKVIFEDYLKENGHDVNELWRKVDEIIATMIKRNEAYLVQEVFGENFERFLENQARKFTKRWKSFSI